MNFPRIGTFIFNLQLESELSLPPYKGAVLRGAVGAVLKRTVCGHPKIGCPDCEMKGQCVYASIFEPVPPAHFADASKFNSATPPYVINPPLTTREKLSSGEKMQMGLVLIGRAIDAIPFFVFTMTRIGRMGLGRKNGKFRVRNVMLKNGKNSRLVFDGEQDQFVGSIHDDIPGEFPSWVNPNGKFQLRFHTPLRMKSKGSLVNKFSFPLFFDALLRRLSLLADFYGNGLEIQDPDLPSRHAREIQVLENHTNWYDWKRYCRRQDYDMKLGGLKGPVTLAGDLAPLLPYLHLGSMVNVGHGTSFGLGKFEINELA